MESVVLDAPAGIDACVGWGPSLPPPDRRLILARGVIATRLGIDAQDVRIDSAVPLSSAQHVRLVASAHGKELPLVVVAADYRTATAVAVADPGTRLGVDVRDLHPDDVERAVMHAHSHLWDGSDDAQFLAHWTRVQAVLAADARGLHVKPEAVRLSGNGTLGWVPDRPARYTLTDLSRNAFVITLASASEVPPAG